MGQLVHLFGKNIKRKQGDVGQKGLTRCDVEVEVEVEVGTSGYDDDLDTPHALPFSLPGAHAQPLLQFSFLFFFI